MIDGSMMLGVMLGVLVALLANLGMLLKLWWDISAVHHNTNSTLTATLDQLKQTEKHLREALVTVGDLKSERKEK